MSRTRYVNIGEKEGDGIMSQRFMAKTCETSIRILTKYGYQSLDTSSLHSFAMQRYFKQSFG